MPRTQTQSNPIAACAVRLKKGARVQLLPDGRFDAPRGAMRGAGPWLLDEQAAMAIIADAAARQNDIAIDYEHQLLNASRNGQPAPAAGWLDPKSLEYIPGEGLYGDVTWTDAAAAAIEADEYRYLSPVFSYDKSTGRVLSLHMAAITNNPAIDGMAELAAASAHLNPEEQPMKELLKRLGLSPDASEDEAVAALSALQAELETAQASLAEKDQALAAASAADPDPAKFVPVETVTKLQDELAALSARIHSNEVDALVNRALDEGRLVPAMEDWARELGKKDLGALSAYIEKAAPIAALAGSQTEGRDPDVGDATAGLDPAALAVCRQMGIDPEDYKQTMAQEG